jgi:environmental stress-induced protein Ves
MTTHRIQLANCAPQPWSNGGGQTRELITWPRAQGWTVRVSIAAIERAGPFSAYPGVERWLAVIEGDGVALALPRGEVTLTASDSPVHFSGAAAPGCRLVNGASQDLNLMVRQAGARAGMRRAGVGTVCDGGAAWRALYVADSAVLDIEGATEAVAAGTLLWSDSRDGAPWQLRQGGRAWWMDLRE